MTDLEILVQRHDDHTLTEGLKNRLFDLLLMYYKYAEATKDADDILIPALVDTDEKQFSGLQAWVKDVFGVHLDHDMGKYALLFLGKRWIPLTPESTGYDAAECVKREIERLSILEADRARKGEIDAGEAVALFRLPMGWTAFGKCLEVLEKEYGPGVRISGRQDHYLKLVK